MTILESLLDRVNAAQARHGFSDRRLGLEAVGSTSVLVRLRDAVANPVSGPDLCSRTIERIHSWLDVLDIDENLEVEHDRKAA